jgi:gliding motility-associated-like protein
LSVPWTQLDSDCLLILDLDEDDSGGALSDIDYVDTVSCRLDSIHITDTDPDVFAYNPVEKLEIFFREAPPDGISEYIEAQVTSGVNITGSGTQHITLTGGTAPDYKELKTALQNLIYRNSSTNPTLGNREIAFVGNTNTITSDTAVAHIYLKDSYKSAGRDTVVQLCSDATAIELENYLSANATLGGSWDEELNTAGIFDPQTDKAGIYDYIVSSAECGEDTAHIAINVNPLPEVNLGNDTTLCHGTVLLLTPDNINAESYKWQDGNTAESYEAKVSGQYTLEVIDANGCANKDSIIISYFSQNEPTRIDTLVCKGKVINWSGVDIDTSGVFTNTTSDRNGCDSTAILHVEYSKYGSLTENDTLICQGQKIEWQGQQIDKNGDYEFTHIDAAGCDSTLILHVGLYPPVKVEIAGNTMICETGKTILIGGDYAKYKWSTGSNSKQIEVVSSGWYLLTITDEHGCNWNDSIYVSQVAPIEAKYSTEPENCYGYQDGKIKLESITGGVGNITGYLNGQEVDLKSEMINLKPDSYVLKLTDSLNCQKEIIINISAAKHIWCDIGKDINTMAGEELEIKLNHNITAVSKIEWMTYGKVVSSNESILRLKPISDTEIIVVVTDEKACEARDTMNIRIKEEIDIYIPNVFSPNGDGINDIYTIRGSKKIEYVESIDIFDRWGENIHHAEHIPFNSIKTPLWDGKYKGKGLLPGVYVYMLKVRANTGETIVKYGDLTLIK